MYIKTSWIGIACDVLEISIAINATQWLLLSAILLYLLLTCKIWVIEFLLELYANVLVKRCILYYVSKVNTLDLHNFCFVMLSWTISEKM